MRKIILGLLVSLNAQAWDIDLSEPESEPIEQSCKAESRAAYHACNPQNPIEVCIAAQNALSDCLMLGE